MNNCNNVEDYPNLLTNFEVSMGHYVSFDLEVNEEIGDKTLFTAQVYSSSNEYISTVKGRNGCSGLVQMLEGTFYELERAANALIGCPIKKGIWHLKDFRVVLPEIKCQRSDRKYRAVYNVTDLNNVPVMCIVVIIKI